MTRDAIKEGNRILNNINEANKFWELHKFKEYIPDALVSRIDNTIEQYISDMEDMLEHLRDYFEYKNDEK